MISASCPRLRVGQLFDFGPEIEAFALTYLAQYNAEAMQPRVLTAFQRAWGMSSITYIPRVAGNEPGLCYAVYNGDGVNKVVVGIEGITNWRQLWSSSSGSLNPTTIAGTQGQVWGLAATYAAAIMAKLQADDAFMHEFTRPNAVLHWGGFSMGGAIAEILTERFHLLRPGKLMRLFKWGAPSVGTARWNESRFSRVFALSTYLETDPADNFPAAGLRLGFDGFLSSPIAPIRYAYDPNQTIWDRRGAHVRAIRGHFIGGVVGLTADYYRTLNEDNPWFWHSMDQYRNMYCEMLYERNDLLKYRFNYLEFNDENSWQVNFAPGRGFQPDMKTVLGTQPPDVRPFNATVAAQVTAEVQPQPIAVQDQFATSVLEGGGDRWGLDDPVVTQTRARRRQ